MRGNIIEYGLKLSRYRDSIYKVYFPAEMGDAGYDQDRAGLTEWAQMVVQDIETIGYEEVPLKDAAFVEPKDSPEMLLWMGNYINDKTDPKWQAVVSSSQDGVVAKEILDGYTESLFTLMAKRDYLVMDDAQIIKQRGILSMYLVMHGKRASRTETTVNPIMYSILTMAMGRYAEVMAKYGPGVLYRDGLKFKRPFACHSGEITFSLEQN